MVVHEPTGPEVIVVEYELVGTRTTGAPPAHWNFADAAGTERH
ncbi:hypothetical protein ACQP2P_26430 [Dactylosporangium sp. CA-139114]